MYLHKTPFWLKILYPSFTWHKNRKEKKLYLTFDDGPIPEVTEFVLDQLALHHAHATFFCVGENVKKHPGVFEKVVAGGHGIGNHTYNHLNGWSEDNEQYLKNVDQCYNIIKQRADAAHPLLLRPPYGKITRSQARQLQGKYEIVMWDVLSGDFDVNLSPQLCLYRTLKYTTNGSIVIFHDSLKAEKNLRYALPAFLDHFSEKGFSFHSL